MSVIGEAAFSVFLNLLLGKMVNSSFNFVNNHKQVRVQLKQWQSILPKILAGLDDAEEKQIKDEGIKMWLADLQDLAYDMDDILDEFAYEDLHIKLQKTQAEANTSKVHKLIPVCCTTSDFTPAAFSFNNKMISKIKDITDRLDNLASQKSLLELREIPGASVGRVFKGMKPRLQPTSLVDESFVYVGREQEKREILELLKSNDGANDGVSVISVVGMGGMGKTTLAQLVYNDTNLQNSFDLKAWVCVSDDFDATNITKNVLTSITSESCMDNDLNMLQVKLKEKILGKRFLLVLDDMWNESYNDWTILRTPFGAGTKIIVTTRSQYVSSNVVTVKSFHLNKLSHEDCLSIFTQHALGARDFNGHLEFKEVGENIVRRCNGLPLAAKTIGGLLRTIKDHNAWKHIYESEMWELSEEQCGIIPALQLSYHHLPSHLKRCFAYCSILPKDYEFSEEEIILLWRAEGFLQQKAKSQVEDLGSQYFWDLVSRSFFQVSSNNESKFVMHDLINDLAHAVAGEICSKLEGNNQQKFSARTRHCSYASGRYDGVTKFEAFDKATHLRTFLPLNIPWKRRSFFTNAVLDELLPRLEYLRVLSLSWYVFTELPNCFENLKHLRYLNFSYTEIKSLPDSICTLHHLETLILRGCNRLEMLPSEIGNLLKLNYLDIWGAVQVKKMPFGIDKLINLHRLSNYIVGEDEGHRIQEIRNFSNLRGGFRLSGLDNVTKIEDIREAKLSDKVGIDGLKLKWNEYFGDGKRNEKFEEKVLDFLYPHKKLMGLSIKNYMGANFSSWIGDPSFISLLYLKLSNCKNCKSLPSIGKLPLLKHLLIKRMDGVTKVGIEFFGVKQSNSFTSLETLHFEDLWNWEEWDCSEVGEQEASKFPVLRKLSLLNCPTLVGRLPNNLHSLRKLVIRKCKRLVVSVTNLSLLSKLEIDECEELKYGSNVEFVSLKRVHLSNILNHSISQEKEGVSHQLSLETKAEELEDKTFQLEKISGVESLTIMKCERLYSKLSKVLPSFTFLTELNIENCSGVVSLSGFNFPHVLKKMEIQDCENLQYLVNERESMGSCTNSLLPEHFRIRSCNSLVYLSSRDDVAILLEHLQIEDCSKLSCLFLNGKLPKKLRVLKVWRCPELESIGQEFEEATSLETIDIIMSPKMKTLPQGLDKLRHVQGVRLNRCLNLVITFEEGESWLPTHVRDLLIFECPKFEILRSINNFTSLRTLEVWRCSADVCFPDEGFPTSITNLAISVASKLLRLIVEWGFHKLIGLQELSIGGEECSDVTLFPEEEMIEMMQLPSSLTRLRIENFENLRCILSDCFHNLTSLQILHIYNCPKLTSLPEKHMLRSLGCLHIVKCPLLKQECKRDEGGEWSKIAHIPCVDIDNTFNMYHW